MKPSSSARQRGLAAAALAGDGHDRRRVFLDRQRNIAERDRRGLMPLAKDLVTFRISSNGSSLILFDALAPIVAG